MRKILSIFALLTAASMLIWIAGCGDDDDDEEAGPPPQFESWNIADGAELAGNATITANFDKPIATATITVTGATGSTAVSGKSATFTPSPAMSAGAHTASVTAEDSDGQAAEGTTSVNFTATAPDTTPPALDGAKCDPPDGADGVDPADYPEKITLAFSEKLSDASVTLKDPDINTTNELAADGMTFVLNLLKVTLSNEQTYTIGVLAKDMAGNEAELEYSFTTMAKEQ
jgi:methionine-rich copper-binding protein CopC